jgi:quinol monooxygenase YgiN
VIVAIADVYAQIPQRDRAERVLVELQQAARAQDGCVSFVLAEVLHDPGHFMLTQSWRERESLEAHFASDAFAAYQNAISPLLVRDSELQLYVVAESVRPLDSQHITTNEDD